jgi:hypothetical protein
MVAWGEMFLTTVGGRENGKGEDPSDMQERNILCLSHVRRLWIGHAYDLSMCAWIRDCS